MKEESSSEKLEDIPWRKNRVPGTCSPVSRWHWSPCAAASCSMCSPRRAWFAPWSSAPLITGSQPGRRAYFEPPGGDPHFSLYW